MIDYKVERNEDCVLIDVNGWVQNESNLLELRRLSGKAYVTCITKVIDENIINSQLSKVKKGDLILLSSVASDIARYRSFQLDDDKDYFSAPISQVMGVFENGVISLKTLKMMPKKILFKRVNNKVDSLLEYTDGASMVGEVVTTSSWSELGKDGNEVSSAIATGDHILIRDNVSTPIVLSNEEYFAVDESMITGLINGQKLKVINEGILMTPYQEEYAFGSSILLAPQINLDDLDYSDMNNRDLFKIEFVDENLTTLHTGDIILVRRDYTNYVYYDGEKYFIINGMKYVSGKIEREVIND